MNYNNKDVYQGMIDILEYWLEQGADGFRIDAINHLFEAAGLPDEDYVDQNGNKNSYDNLIHDKTMNQVSLNFETSLQPLNGNHHTARVLRIHLRSQENDG